MTGVPQGNSRVQERERERAFERPGQTLSTSYSSESTEHHHLGGRFIMNPIYHLDSNIQTILCINHERTWKMYFAILQRWQKVQLVACSWIQRSLSPGYISLISPYYVCGQGGSRNGMTGLGESTQTKGKVVCRQNTPEIL